MVFGEIYRRFSIRSRGILSLVTPNKTELCLYMSLLLDHPILGGVDF